MAVIATAEVRVVADTSRFLSNLRRQLRGAFAQMGAQAATSFNQQFQRNLGNQVNQTMQRSAQQGARSFTDTLRTNLRRGLRGLQIVTDLNLTLVQGFRAAGELGGRALIAGFRTSGRAIADGIRSEIVPAFQTMGRDLSRDLVTPLQAGFGRAVQAARLLGRAITQIPNISFGNVTVELERGVRFVQTDLSRAFGGVFDNLAVGARLAFSRISDIAPGFFQQAADRIGPIFSRLYDAISVNTLLFNGRLLQHWDDGVGGLGDRTTSSLDNVRQRFRIAFASLAVDVGLAFRGVGVGVGRAFSAIGEGATRSFNTIAPQANRAAQAISAAFSRVADPIAANIRRTGPRIQQAIIRAFAPAVASASRAFSAIPWGRIGQGIGQLFGRGVGDGAEEETQRRGRSIGARFGAAMTRGLTIGLRGLGTALASISIKPLAGLAGILGNATSEMVSMAAEGLLVVGLLESLSGILFALPAVLNLTAAAVATVAIAFNGFGTAIGAAFDDTAAFEQSLEGLAPAAQGVAREFRNIAPALTELRLDAQQALFEQLGGSITAIAANLLPSLSAGLNLAAAAFGGILAEMGEFFAQAASADTVTATFEVLSGIFDALAQSTQPFLEAMRLLVDTFLPRIAEGIDPIATAGELFQDWTERVVESGEAMDAFDLALNVFSELGSIIADLGGIFQATFSAAQLAGVDALGGIAVLLEVIRAAFESFEGQVALANIFSAINVAVTALAPVFGTLLTQLGLVFPIIGQIAEAIGPSLSVVLEGLGQAILAMGPGLVEVFAGIAEAAIAIAPSLGPLGESIGAILTAIAPILPVIGQLIGIVVQLGAQIIGVLASAITPIVTALASSLAPVLPQIADLFSRLVEAVAPVVVALGAGLASVIATLLPPILELVLALAGSLMPIIEALLPVLTPIIDIFFQLVEVVGSLLLPIIALLLPIIEAIAPIFELIGVVLAPLLELLSAILEPITALITIVASLLTPVIEFLAEIIGAIISAALVPLTAAFEFLAGILADHVIPWFNESVLVLQFFWEEAIQPLIEWIRRLADGVNEKFGTIRDAVTTLWNLWKDRFDLAKELLSVVIEAVSDFVGEVGDGFKSLGNTISDVWDNIVSGIETAWSTIENIGEQIFNLVDRALSAASDLTNLDLNPFADGGIVNRPTAALIGEAGREVVIPLTRPGRAVELAQQSGLIDLLAAQGALAGIGATAGAATGPIVGEMHVHSMNSDPEQVARRAVRMIERRISGRGLERTR